MLHAVSSTGFVTPKKVGTATITVTSKANKKVKAAYKVTVKKNDMVLAVGFDMYNNIKYYVKKNDDGTIVVQTDACELEKCFQQIKKLQRQIHYDIGFVLTSSNENVIKIRC